MNDIFWCSKLRIRIWTSDNLENDTLMSLLQCYIIRNSANWSINFLSPVIHFVQWKNNLKRRIPYLILYAAIRTTSAGFFCGHDGFLNCFLYNEANNNKKNLLKNWNSFPVAGFWICYIGTVTNYFKCVQSKLGMAADLLNTMATRLRLMNDRLTYSINHVQALLMLGKAPSKEWNSMCSIFNPQWRKRCYFLL